MEPIRIIIAGGGTGGHIFPAVAIAHALKKHDANTELLFVGANGKMEMEKVPKEGFTIIGLDIVGFNRSNLLKNILLPFKLIKSLFRARSIIKDFKPNLVVGVGGYASFPILKEAQGLGIKTLIQEQNSFAGKSNKILAKNAQAVCVAYENMDRFFPKNKIHLTGNPVRKSILSNTVDRNIAIDYFQLDARKKTLLIIGGSLGAKTINETIEEHLNEILSWNIQLLWQTGSTFYKIAKSKFDNQAGVFVYEFISKMEYAYAASDFIISRAGALSIAEICIIAKPVVFVPYPYAAEDHQTSNAMSLVKHNAAMMVKDVDCKNELIGKLKSLIDDNDLQELMIKNLKQLAIKDADERIKDIIVDLINSKP